MKYLITCLIVAVLTACDRAPDIHQDPGSETGKQVTPGLPRGKATRYGLFSERGRGWVVQDENTSTGKLLRKPKLEFVEQTDRIPLRKGTFFGYNYWLKIEPDQPRADLKRVLMHPEMTLPDGTKASHSERYLKKPARYGIITSLDAYALGEDHELVEGDWTFQLWYRGDLLVEQTFTTYWPENVADPAQESSVPDTQPGAGDNTK